MTSKNIRSTFSRILTRSNHHAQSENQQQPPQTANSGSGSHQGHGHGLGSGGSRGLGRSNTHNHTNNSNIPNKGHHDGTSSSGTLTDLGPPRPSTTRVGVGLNQISSITAYLERNRYHFGVVIGTGSYSTVRLTTRFNPNGTVAHQLATKVINKEKASNDFVKKFLPRELGIVGRLQHPNIVRVFDIVQFEKKVYIFMEFCEDGDLLEYIKIKGQLSEALCVHYFRQLLSAVKYLHNMDLAHRDLKCENILLSRGDIKVSDFGFSRFCRDENGKRVLSETYCGSAAYAAPEILRGTEYNPKLYDMWSLGCILFIMLTGHMPFDEENIKQMLANQLARYIKYPEIAEMTVSVEAKACVGRLLEPDITMRANVNQALMDPWVTTRGKWKGNRKSSYGGGMMSPHGQQEMGSKGNKGTGQRAPGFF